MTISRHGTSSVQAPTCPSASASPSHEGMKATAAMMTAKSSRLSPPRSRRGLMSRSSDSMALVSSDAYRIRSIE